MSGKSRNISTPRSVTTQILLSRVCAIAVARLFSDRSDSIWIGDDRPICRWGPRETTESYALPHVLKPNTLYGTVRALAGDEAGSLWGRCANRPRIWPAQIRWRSLEDFASKRKLSRYRNALKKLPVPHLRHQPRCAAFATSLRILFARMAGSSRERAVFRRRALSQLCLPLRLEKLPD